MLDKVIRAAVGALGALAAVGAAAGVVAGVRGASRAFAEDKRRRETPVEWDPRFPQEAFQSLVTKTAQRLPRVYAGYPFGLGATIHVKSNSGLTSWKAEIDFNDYGRFTGRYWITSENDQSPIPQAFAEAIATEARSRLDEQSSVA